MLTIEYFQIGTVFMYTDIPRLRGKHLTVTHIIKAKNYSEIVFTFSEDRFASSLVFNDEYKEFFQILPKKTRSRLALIKKCSK